MIQTKGKKASRVWKQCAVIFLKLLRENLNSWIFDHHTHSDQKSGISFRICRGLLHYRKVPMLGGSSWKKQLYAKFSKFLKKSSIFSIFFILMNQNQLQLIDYFHPWFVFFQRTLWGCTITNNSCSKIGSFRPKIHDFCLTEVSQPVWEQFLILLF